MATTMVRVVDSLVSQQSFTQGAMDIQDARIHTLGNGLELTERLANQLFNERTEDQERILQLEHKVKEVHMEAASNTRRSKTSLSAIQTMQLEAAQNIVILRGVRPLWKEETYEDLEKAVIRVFSQMKISDSVKIHYVRRLPGPKGIGQVNPSL